MNNISKGRRAFFLQGGAALSAGMATAAVATPTSGIPTTNEAGELQLQVDLAEDREAIRKLHLAFVGQIETHAYSTGTGKLTILRVRANHLQQKDSLSISENRLQATATWHVDAAVGTPLLGDSTVAQMARLQGQVADHRWESGRFDARYVKVNGQWRIASLDYQT